MSENVKKYRYAVMHINEKENWISIQNDNPYDIDAFVNLMKKIQDSCNGRIKEVGYLQYCVIGSKYNLIYQWDSCFGIVVIYDDCSKKDESIDFLEKYY